MITEGHAYPHDILAIKGRTAVENYLIQEVQKVYRLQGVEINDKTSRSLCGRCCARSGWTTRARPA